METLTAQAIQNHARHLTLQQWLKENPNASINAYYSEFGAQAMPTINTATSAPTAAPVAYDDAVDDAVIKPVVRKARVSVQNCLLGLAALAGVLVFTNPDEAKHKEAFKQAIVNAVGVEEKASEATEGSGLEGMIAFAGRSIVMQLADAAAYTMLNVDDYVLFSLTRVTFDKETNIIGIGVMGKVYISDEVDANLKKHFNL